MKNILKATTALSAVGAIALAGATAHAAEKLKMGISGSMTSKIGYANQKSAFEKAVGKYGTINLVNDSEVHFSGSTKLDNGINVYVKVELEADQAQSNNGTVLDETYAKLTGGFGDLRLGSTHPAGNVLAHYAPDYGVESHWGHYYEIWAVNPNGTSTPVGDVGDNDSMKVVYYTPKIEGFQAGLSYAPSKTNTDNVPLTGGNSKAAGTAQTDQGSLGLSFERKLGEVDVAADGSYWFEGGTTDQKGYRFGGTLGFSGFSVGGSYASVDNHIGGITASTSVSDYTAYDAGIGYKAGPYKVSFDYNHTDSPKSSATPGSDTSTLYVFGGTYNVSPGIDFKGSVFRADYSDETTAASLNNDALGVVAAIKVSF